MILLRHTRPAGAEGLCYGRTDLPPGPDLPAEAARLAAALPPVARIVTSPLTRCARLAATLAAARGLPLAVEPRLVEIDFGAWEGRAWAAIPRAEIDAWAADLLYARPHGGETVAELAARAAEGLAAAAAAGPGPVLVVAHAGVIRAALAPQLGPAAWQHPVGFGSWLELAPAAVGGGR